MLLQPEYKEVLSIEREIVTDGHSPLLVITSDFEHYIIKSTRGQRPSYPLINEFLCSFLLHHWELNVPTCAAVKLNPGLLKDRGFSPFHQPHFYSDITFGSKIETGSIEMGEFMNIHSKPDMKKLRNPEDLLKIALFDIWVENSDRKPTNYNILLKTNSAKLDIFAIDHAFTFDSVKYSDLNPA